MPQIVFTVTASREENLVIYRHVDNDEVVTILRIVHRPPADNGEFAGHESLTKSSRP